MPCYHPAAIVRACAFMTKPQLLNTLAEAAGTSKTATAAVLDALIALTYKEAKKTGEFTLPGLGKLVKAKRKARLGRNPFTGQPLKIAAKTTLKFRISKTAKDAVLGVAAKKESTTVPAKSAKPATKPAGKPAKAARR